MPTGLTPRTIRLTTRKPIIHRKSTRARWNDAALPPGWVSFILNAICAPDGGEIYSSDNDTVQMYYSGEQLATFMEKLPCVAWGETIDLLMTDHQLKRFIKRMQHHAKSHNRANPNPMSIAIPFTLTDLKTNTVVLPPKRKKMVRK